MITDALILAIAQVESGNDDGAIRVEPSYRWHWDVRANRPWQVSPDEARHMTPPPDFPAVRGTSQMTEWVGQRTSWGALQVMGAVAREYGYRGHFGGLCGPLGREYGRRHLETLARRYGADSGLEGVIASYNAGSPRKDSMGRWVNFRYVNKVLAALETEDVGY